MAPQKHQRINANYFSLLSQEDDMTNDSQKTKTIQLDIPPVKVLSKSTDFVHKLCAAGDINDYSIKKMSIGIKIFAESEKSYEEIIKLLRECKCQFFTHGRKSDRHFKAVLKGLEDLSADPVKSELLNCGLKCKEVQCITKKFSHGTETIYIASFENGTVKLADLNKNFSTLFRTIVKWSYHRRPKNMLVQCRNCQMFGHGEKWCSVTAKCCKCAGNHKTTECVLSDDIAGKCANCEGHHRSNDPDCPSRINFISIRERIRSRRNASQQRNTFSYNAEHFPPVNNNNNRRSNNYNVTSSQPGTYKPTLNAWSTPLRGLKDDGRNLFTVDEIADLTFDVIHQLKSCNSKEEQFSVLTKLAVKYLYKSYV